jgi:hypothetical protein
MTKRNINVSVGTPVIRKSGYSFAMSDRVVIEDRCSIYPESNISDLIETLKDIEQKYGTEYTNLSIESEECSSCYRDCNCSPNYYVYGNRMETDLEYNFRIEKEAGVKADNEAREREAYEKLKAKFGD